MINKAKIEIRTRDVKGVPYIPFKGNAQHLFIIYTDSNGQETILRGGPETDSILGMAFDNLKVIKSPYLEQYKHLFPNDFVKNAPSVIIAQGTDKQIQGLINKMWIKGQEINAGYFDYKLPVPFVVLQFVIYKIVIQQ